MNKYYGVIIIFLIIGLGCDKALNLDIEFEGEKLVVFSKLTSNQPITVQVSKSINPYASEKRGSESHILDANVTILEDGEPFTICTLNENYPVYVGDSNDLPVIGKEYLLIIETQQFETLVSDPVTIPDTVSLDIEVINTGKSGGFGNVTDMKFSFQDPSGINNAYGYDLLRDLRDGQSLSGFTWSIDQTFDEKCNFYRSELLGRPSIGSVFDDMCFDGQNLTLNITSQIIGSGSFAFRFYTFDPILFEYYKSLSRFTEAGVGYLDPLRIPGNVKGGYGIIAGYNYVERTVFLGDEEN